MGSKFDFAVKKVKGQPMIIIKKMAYTKLCLYNIHVEPLCKKKIITNTKGIQEKAKRLNKNIFPQMYNNFIPTYVIVKKKQTKKKKQKNVIDLPTPQCLMPLYNNVCYIIPNFHNMGCK